MKNDTPLLKLKSGVIAVLISAIQLLELNAVYAQVTLNVDYNNNLTPATLERGYLLEAAIDQDKPDFDSKLQQMKGLGCTLVTLPRDLNQYNTNWPNDGKYYLSYRSKGGNYFGADGQSEEFKTNASGGIVVDANDDFVNICKSAKNKGLRPIIQMSGTPVFGKNNGNVNQLFNLDPTRKFHESARFYALPAPGDYQKVANALGTWMQQIKNATGANNIIWAGHQEPSHTPGYPDTNNDGIGDQTNEESKKNTKQYVKAWKPVAKKVKDLGVGTSAGIQLNQSPKEHADAIKALADNKVPMNFYSVQMYRSQDNQQILDLVISNLDKYAHTSGKKIVFNRYDTYRRKGDPLRNAFNDKTVRFNSAKGLVRYFEDEQVLLDHADRMLGYALFKGAFGQPMMDKVMKFMTSMPTKRKKVTGLGSGLGGWVTATQNDMYMVLYNTGAKKTVKVNLNNFPNTYGSHQMNSRRGSGTQLKGFSGPNWNPSTKKITNIVIKKNEFFLIQLNANGTASRVADFELSGQEEFALVNQISIYPNPANSVLNVEIPDGTQFDRFQLVNTAGQIVKVFNEENLKPGLNNLNISGIESGIYILTSRINGQEYTKRLVISK